MNTELITVLWMWFTPTIVFILPLWFLLKTGYIVLGQGCPSERWLLPNIILLGAIFACVYYQAQINHVGWNGGWVLYGMFEYFGSWVVGTAFICWSAKLFQAKHTYLEQKFDLGIDPATIDVGKYIVRLSRNQFSREEHYNLELLQATTKSDSTGDYTVLTKVYTFKSESKNFYTKEKVIEVLKDYFDNERLFTVEGEGVIVEASKREPEVLIIR